MIEVLFRRFTPEGIQSGDDPSWPVLGLLPAYQGLTDSGRCRPGGLARPTRLANCQTRGLRGCGELKAKDIAKGVVACEVGMGPGLNPTSH